ncbi:hypothetical protein PGT21_028021 [Puccinia graminis f. sp. tritici]|uniref:Uncharacterized protein n=1 Tax=Puccinia graminis f. sp. tritici TaxID=56615 RepID=A0A5B0NKG6_PUCGR|nr:hypothetical protein PGT21_028021 [Puccinia graminis f. sp. tritici]
MGPAHPDIRSDLDIRSRFQPNQTFASASASSGGYPRGYPRISAPKMTLRLQNETNSCKFLLA